MSINAATKNPIEIRKAGIRALTAALGHDDTQMFLTQYRGSGDFTKERRELPEQSFEEIIAELREIEAEIENDEGYRDIKIIKGGK